MASASPPREPTFSERRFWRKTSVRRVLEKALWLYYALQSPNTPKWARRIIYGALGYFILPLDLIPDIAPLIGYTDDLGVMSAALVAVAFTINDQVKQQARDRLERWFGAENPVAPPRAE